MLKDNLMSREYQTVICERFGEAGAKGYTYGEEVKKT